MDQKILEKIDRILENAQGNPLDIYYTLYCEYLRPSERPSQLLEYIGQKGLLLGAEDAPAAEVSDEVRNSIQRAYYTLLHEIVRLTMAENLPIDGFYEKLFQQIFGSGLFPKGDAERAVLLWLLMERTPEIPYYQAVGLLVRNDGEYREAIKRVESQLHQAVHMLNRHFPSRTEETSQLVRIASEISSEEDRVIYWAVLISMIQRSVQQKSPEE